MTAQRWDVLKQVIEEFYEPIAGETWTREERGQYIVMRSSSGRAFRVPIECSEQIDALMVER